MVNGIRASDLCGLNKGRVSKFCIGSIVRQETSEKGKRTNLLKRCEYNNKDENNSPKILNDEDQAPSQKIRRQKLLLVELLAVSWVPYILRHPI